MNKRLTLNPIRPKSIAWLASCILFLGIAGGHGQNLRAQVQPAEPGKPISAAIAKSPAEDDSNIVAQRIGNRRGTAAGGAGDLLQGDHGGERSRNQRHSLAATNAIPGIEGFQSRDDWLHSGFVTTL